MLKNFFIILNIYIFILTINSKPKELFLPKQLRKKIIGNKYINLYFGLDIKKFLYSEQIQLEYDFLENNILLNSTTKCDIQNNCRKSSKINGPENFPKDGKYYYYNSKTFLGLTQQITQTIKNSDKDYFVNCPIKILDKESDFQKNILGMGPNSPIWKHWNDLYNFYQNNIHFSFVLHPDFKNIFFWNLKIIRDDTYILIDKSNSYYIFKTTGGFYYMNDITYNDYNFCLRMQNDKLFSLKTDLFNELKKYLCKDDTNCFKKEHLEKLEGFSWNFKYNDYKNPQRENSFSYLLSDFYSFDENDNIIWNFEEQDISEYKDCDIFLERKFFETHYFSIVNNLTNPFFSLLSINRFNPNSFNEQSYFVYLAIYSNLFIIVIVFAFIFFSYIYIGKTVESFKRKKLENKIRKRQISENIQIKEKLMK